MGTLRDSIQYFFGCVLIIMVYTHHLSAQDKKYRNLSDVNEQMGVLIDFNYSAHYCAGSFSLNYPYAFGLGSRIQLITRSNIMLGISGNYIFNDEVSSDLVANLREEEGYIIDRFGELSNVEQGLRGYSLFGTAAYLVPVLKSNKRSGIECRVSVGYIRHWARIEVRGGEIFSLKDDYLKGYDQLHDGIALQQYVGYRHLDPNKLINLFAGFEFNQGFTTNRRGYNYQFKQSDTANKVDLMFGFKIGLTLPFYIYSALTEKTIKYY